MADLFSGRMNLFMKTHEIKSGALGIPHFGVGIHKAIK